MSAVAHPGNQEHQGRVARIGHAVGVGAIDIVGTSWTHRLRPSSSIAIHEDQRSRSMERPHEFSPFWFQMKVAPGHEEFAVYIARLNHGGRIEEAGMTLDLAWAPISFINDAVEVALWSSREDLA